jgi:excisionase family DNA binding protein
MRRLRPEAELSRDSFHVGLADKLGRRMSLTLEREYLTAAEAAVLWRVSVPTVYRRCADGSIPHIRVGGGDGPIRIPARVFEVPAERDGPDVSPAVDPSPHGGKEAA